MRKRLIALLAAGVLLLTVAPPVSAAPVMPSPAGCPAGTVFVESQGWWNKNGIVVPTSVGHHTHVSVCEPVDGVVVDGTVDFQVGILTHDQIGTVTSFRVSDSSNVIKTVPVSVGPGDAQLPLTFSVNFSSWSAGLHELRWTANISKNSEGNRQYQSTEWLICVRACSPNRSARTTPDWGARGWYTGRGYANAWIKNRLPLNINAPVSYKIGPGSGGKATKYGLVTIDPDMHHGNAGLVLRTCSAACSGTVSIPSGLASGWHKLAVVSSDGLNAGVFVAGFFVP